LNVEALTLGVKPAGSFPTRTDDDVGALLQHMCQWFGMQEAAVSDDNISFGDWRTIEPLAAFFIGAMFTDRDQASVAMLNEAETLGG